MSALVVGVTNQKGGVGKTTVTFNFGRAAVCAGLRTLIVDLDPQGNLSTIGAREELAAGALTVADVLTARGDVRIQDAIVDGNWAGLNVLPANDALAQVRDELVVAGGGREARLREALAEVSEDYDLILIDCPPSLDLLTMNALTAANTLVIVAEAGLFSANGIAKLRETIETVQKYYNPSLSISGVIINRFEAQTLHDQEWRKQLGNHIQPILKPEIGKHTWIKDASEAGMGLDELGTRSAKRLFDAYSRWIESIRKA